jgi:4a-hydroxytetrahydrobiopterin dehydratase
MVKTEWLEKDNTLQRTFRFHDFVEAWAFMTEVAFHVEKLGHHPNWSNVWNTVEVKLTTHDAGNKVTAKDHELAAAIDKVFKKYEA